MKADWFGPRLQELRAAKGWTQQQLADAAGLAVGVVRKLERRENKPTWETALALADTLGVSCEAFTQAPAKRPPSRPGRPPKQKAEGAPLPASPAPPPAEELEEQGEAGPVASTGAKRKRPGARPPRGK
jgi:transcriptional regulator with XRE-family HTH domain